MLGYCNISLEFKACVIVPLVPEAAPCGVVLLLPEVDGKELLFPNNISNSSPVHFHPQEHVSCHGLTAESVLCEKLEYSISSSPEWKPVAARASCKAFTIFPSDPLYKSLRNLKVCSLHSRELSMTRSIDVEVTEPTESISKRLSSSDISSLPWDLTMTLGLPDTS